MDKPSVRRLQSAVLLCAKELTSSHTSSGRVTRAGNKAPIGSIRNLLHSICNMHSARIGSALLEEIQRQVTMIVHENCGRTSKYMETSNDTWQKKIDYQWPDKVELNITIKKPEMPTNEELDSLFGVTEERNNPVTKAGVFAMAYGAKGPMVSKIDHKANEEYMSSLAKYEDNTNKIMKLASAAHIVILNNKARTEVAIASMQNNILVSERDIFSTLSTPEDFTSLPRNIRATIQLKVTDLALKSYCHRFSRTTAKLMCKDYSDLYLKLQVGKFLIKPKNPTDFVKQRMQTEHSFIHGHSHIKEMTIKEMMSDAVEISKGYKIDMVKAREIANFEMARMSIVDTANNLAFITRSNPTPTEKPMDIMNMNFTVGKQDFTRVFGEEITDITDDMLMTRIRRANQEIESLKDLEKTSKKVAAQIKTIRAGIKVLVKKLDEGMEDDTKES